MTLLNLHHLKYFIDAIDTGSISAAAQKNLVSHPAVSRAIKALEDQLDIKLLIHRRSTFKVTAEGLAIAERGRILLDSVKDLSAGRIKPLEPSGTVVLQMSRSIGQMYLSSILEELEKNYPKIKLHVHFGTTGEIVEHVISGSVDLGMTIGQHRMATIKQTLLKTGEFVLASSGNKKTSAKDLSSVKFILTEPRFETENLKKSFHQKFNTPLILKHEVDSWDMIAKILSADGSEIGLFPDIMIEKYGLSLVKSDWFNCSYNFYLHQSKTTKNSQGTKALAEVIEKLFKGKK